MRSECQHGQILERAHSRFADGCLLPGGKWRALETTFP